MLANQEIRKFCNMADAMSFTAPTRLDMADKASGKIPRPRIILVIGTILTALISARLIYINTISNEFLTKQLSTRVNRTIILPAMRGTIVDRNDHPLAVSTPVASIWVDPSELDSLSSDLLHKVATILNMTVADISKKTSDKNKTFVYLKRAISPEQAEQINQLEIDGVYSIQEFKRFYPSGEVTAHVVGFNNIDDRGSEGIEYANDKTLIGHDGMQQIVRDRQGSIIETVGEGKAAENGKTVQLSIDNRIQYLAYNALKKQVEKFNAKGGSVVVLDAKTGEVLSMVNMPTYNPNNRANATLDNLRNRAAIDLYEPGSTIKPLTVAKALDMGIVTPSTAIATMPYKVGPKIIHDVHDRARMTVSEIIEKSSNVGVSKIALKMKAENVWKFNHDVGFGQKIGTNFPGEAKGNLRPWQKWYPIDLASISYGYAISVSLMQMARAYSVFTNNGCLLPLSFYKVSNGKVNCTQVISGNTAHTMRDILSRATDGAGGTGKRAQLDNYTTAGKTGTSHKLANRGYAAHNYISSFVGFAPATNAKLIIAIMIDEPHGAHYGGAVAAPVFAEIAGPSLHLLGVKPDRVNNKN
jgi:cell division protein FtsI (penicillin-binding protein 3)